MLRRRVEPGTRRQWSAFTILIGLLVSVAVAAQTGVEVTGIIEDQSGAVLPGAAVVLQPASGDPIQATADANGGFRMPGVPAGAYDLTASYEGFSPATTRLRITNRPPGRQRLVLAIAAVKQEVTVSNAPAVAATAASNVDAVSVNTDTLASLPILDNDVLTTMARFLDLGSLGNGGLTIIVNGMQVSALNVSASAIQQLRINQDPYSAEYSRPGRGRVEILTKPGGSEYHGELTLIGRDSRLNARNAFATTRVPEDRGMLDGFLGGPLGSSGKTAFMLSADDSTLNQQAYIDAIGPSGPILGTLPQVSGRARISGSVTHQVSDRTTISIRPVYQYETDENRGVGGTTLASAANTFTHHEQQVTYTQQTVFRPTLIHQVQVLVGHEREPVVSASSDPSIVVAGAFTGGGAQADLLRTEVHMNLNDNLTWTAGHHLVQAGFQLPDWSRRGFFDSTDVGGTFSFSGLDTYAAGQPYAYTVQRGNGSVVFLEKQVGAYLKDDWQARADLSVGLGLRYDWQNYFHDDNNLVPRLSISYAPHNVKTTVIRTGVGVFNDRSGPVVIADLLHAQPGGLTRLVVSNPGYPDPFSSLSAAATPPSTVRLAPDVQIPQTLQYSVGVDQQLRKRTTLSINYIGARGYHLFRSRDINAPLPPFYAARPDPTWGVVREVESTGRQQSDSLQATVRGQMTSWFNGQAQYTLSRINNDTSGLTVYPANDYDLTGEWGRADFDRRHRLAVLGRVTAVKFADVGVGLTMNSATPYSELLGADIYNNGRGNARPSGVSRNTLEGAGFASLDLRLSREVRLRGAGQSSRAVIIALDAFNVTNRVNYGSFVGTVGSPLFGRPITAQTPRQLQVSGRIRF